ncbi:MAG TPA: endolytic transglycosylase MltG [Acidimicrobiales bacterium]|nr:endolytic transglycosylase MltG [Acidimicrobiales bacterium]
MSEPPAGDELGLEGRPPPPLVVGGDEWSDPEVAEPAVDGDGPAPSAPAEDAGRGAARREAKRAARRRRRRITLGVLGGIVLLVIGFVAWYELESHPTGAIGPPVQVQVAKGEATDTLVGDLAGRGVIGSSLAFRLYLFFHGTPNVTPGRYLFHQNQAFGTVHEILSGGPDVFPVVVYPGFTLQEVARSVGDLPGHSSVNFLSVAKSGEVASPYQPAGSDNLEGLVGSGTYEVVPGETERQLLQAMVQRFDRQAVAAGLTPAAAAALGYTPYEVVTVASIVQKEGYYPKNMGPVARVIYNRLAQGTPLQMDSTVLYSLGQDGGTVTQADLALDTPYNTYKHTGLTPTPISIPSPKALTAAVHPPPGDWLFFVVVSKDGTEAFSDTYAGQQANEQLAKSRGL